MLLSLSLLLPLSSAARLPRAVTVLLADWAHYLESHAVGYVDDDLRHG